MENEQVLSTPEKLASLLLMSFSLTSVARGFFWIINTQSAINDSPFYHKLHEIAPLWLWGAILVFFGINMAIASFYIPKRLLTKKFEFFVIVGCTGSAIYYFFMTVVSMVDALNWLTPVNFLIQTSCLGLCGFMGALSYARKR